MSKLKKEIRTKVQAGRFFGGYASLGRAWELSRQSVEKWPRWLSQKRKDQILGAGIRLNKIGFEDISWEDKE